MPTATVSSRTFRPILFPSAGGPGGQVPVDLILLDVTKGAGSKFGEAATAVL
jgi:hypothetical protein